jgi:hypothetical protein
MPEACPVVSATVIQARIRSPTFDNLLEILYHEDNKSPEGFLKNLSF